MKKMLASVGALVLAAGVGTVLGAGPAQAAPGCLAFNFCLHDTATVNPSATFSAELPRNTCLRLTSPNIASFATENTGVQWWLFRTSTCGGSHLPVHANTDLDLSSVSGWNNAVAAVMRTSTVG